jgi:hypothetical protein
MWAAFLFPASWCIHPKTAYASMTVLAKIPFLSNRDPSPPDIGVGNHFSLFLIRPFSEQGEAWLRENVCQDSQWFGDALIVEPRFVGALLEGMIANGLTLLRGWQRAGQ